VALAGQLTIAIQGTVAVLTCYLDDSGTHDESPLETVADYIIYEAGGQHLSSTLN
jgi:hypothetical protein